MEFWVCCGRMEVAVYFKSFEVLENATGVEMNNKIYKGSKILIKIEKALRMC